MKKYLLLLSAILFASYSYTQGIKASIGLGSAADKIKIYLQTDATQALATFSTLQFNVAIPAGTTPIPTLTVLSSAFTGVSWIVAAPYTENGYINYNIYTNSAGFQLPVTANVEFQAMEVGFGGGPAGAAPNRAYLVCLPDGGNGDNGNGLFYCTGSVNSNGQALFYARDANVTIANGNTYAPIRPGAQGSPLGNFTSFARLNPAVTLPIKFTDFTAVKRNNDGLLSWTVSNQDPNTVNYGIERSFNGTDFTSLGTVDANYNLGTVGTYGFTDANITRLRSSGVIYYRIKEVDRDGHFIYSEIRSIKLDGKPITINLYPNPAQAYTNLILDLQDATPVAVSITDVTGQTMQQFSFPGVKGNNQQRINLNKFAAGTYMIKVVAGTEMQTISVVKTN